MTGLVTCYSHTITDYVDCEITTVFIIGNVNEMQKKYIEDKCLSSEYGENKFI